MTGQADIWLTPTDVAVIWRVPPGTVYRLASHHRWRRRKTGRAVRYHGDDVQASFPQDRLTA